MPLEHPEIGWVERTGYPSWLQDDDCSEEFDEDRAYEERRDSVFDRWPDGGGYVMPGFKARYGFSSREVSTLYESIWRSKDLKNGCGWKKFDDFVLWASETGYEKYASLRRVRADKPYGPDNAVWDFPETVKQGYPKGHPCKGCDLEPLCSTPCDIRLKYWDDGMAQLKRLMDGHLKN